MSKIPETWKGLADAGYVFDGEGRCKGCGEKIEFWITPNNRKMPMRVFALDADGQPIIGASVKPVKEWVRRSHFSDCPNAAEFRKKK